MRAFKSVKSYFFIGMECEKKFQNSECADLAFSNGLLFLALSIIGKIGVILVFLSDNIGIKALLLFENEGMGEKRVITLVDSILLGSAIVYEDLIISFLVIIATYSILKKTGKNRGHIISIIKGLQFLYMILVISSIEHFRLFKNNIGLTFIIAFYELFTHAGSKLTEAREYAGILPGLAYIGAYSFILFFLWPKIWSFRASNHLLAGDILRNKNVIFILCVFLLLFFPSANIHLEGYGLGRNQLSVICQNGWHITYTEYIANYHGYFFPQKYQGDRFVIDKDYPLFHASLEKICGMEGMAQKERFREKCSEMDSKDISINSDPTLNIVLIILESISAHELEIYGNEEKNTPNLMAYRNMTFLSNRHYATSARSKYNEYSIFCSLYPVVPVERKYILGQYCLPNILGEYGYETSYYHTGMYWQMYPKFIGWDNFIKFENSSFSVLEEEHFLPVFEDYVAKKTEQPFFTVFRMKTGHSPRGKTDIPRAVDYFIAGVIDILRGGDIFESTLIIVIGDEPWHRRKVSEIPTPFLMINPKMFEGGESSTIPSNHLDLGPTIMHITGIDEVVPYQGQNILALSDTDRRLYFNDRMYESGFLQADTKFVMYPGGKMRLYLNSTHLEDIDDAVLMQYKREFMGWRNSMSRMILDGEGFTQG